MKVQQQLPSSSSSDNEEKIKPPIQLPDDVFRIIIRNSMCSKSIFAIHSSCTHYRDLVCRELRFLSKRRPIRLNIKELVGNNPFKRSYYDRDDPQSEKMFFNKIRALCSVLESYMEKFEVPIVIENLTPWALGWFYEMSEDELPRCPMMLQKRVKKILLGCKNSILTYSYPFMKSSRFIKVVTENFEAVTSLNLGDIMHVDSVELSQHLFPNLLNLTEFEWHHADISAVTQLRNKDNMKRLILTYNIPEQQDYNLFGYLARFTRLKSFYFGFLVPHSPTRIQMEILLNLHQTVWRRKLEENKNKLLPSMSSIKEIGFWNVPEKFFIDAANARLSYSTINFGFLTQDQRKMCSFDSLLQAFFKFEESGKSYNRIQVKNLNMNMHAMPVVSLEYYFPNLMNHVNKISSLKKISLVVRSCFASEMNSSWSLETKKEMKMRKILPLANYTHFSLHVDTFCVFTDLERQLPTSLQSLSISLDLPVDNSAISVKSLVAFIAKLGDINDFPELEELHLQVWGVACMEMLVDAVVANVAGSLKKLSIIGMPENEERKEWKILLKKLLRACPNAQEVAVSTEFAGALFGESLKFPNWKEVLQEKGVKYGKGTRARLTVGSLPNIPGIHVKPHFVKLEKKMVFEDEESVYEKSFVQDGDEEDDVGDEEEYDEEEYESESEDELDQLEKKLEKESNRRHKKWTKERRRLESTSSVEDDDDEDVVDFANLTRSVEDDESRDQNGFFDNEAEEASDEEEEEDEEEPEYFDIEDSEDDRLINEDVHEIRKRKKTTNERNNDVAKRRRIIVSSDEDD